MSRNKSHLPRPNPLIFPLLNRIPPKHLGKLLGVTHVEQLRW
jgi:hypothetical protein